MSRFTLVFKIVGFVLSLVLQVVLARLMGVRDFGDYTVIMTWINMLVAFCLFGFDYSTARFLPSFFESQNKNKARGVMRFGFRFILGTSVLCMIVLFYFLLNHSRRHTLTYSEAFFWSIFLVPLLAIIYQSTAIFSAIKKQRQTLIMTNVLLPLVIVVAVFISYFFNKRVLRLDTAVFWVLICTFFISWIINGRLKREVRPMYSGASPEYEYGAWFKASAGLLALNFLPAVLARVDILFISGMIGNSKAGIYSAASAFALIIPLAATLTESWNASDQGFVQNNDGHPFRKYFSGSKGRLSIFMIAVALLFILFGKYLLQIYGKEFRASYIPLLILTGGQLVSTYTFIYCNSFISSGNKMKPLILVFFLGVVLAMWLNYLFVPQWGSIGAAIATSLSLVGMSLGIFVVFRKQLYK